MFTYTKSNGFARKSKSLNMDKNSIWSSMMSYMLGDDGVNDGVAKVNDSQAELPAKVWLDGGLKAIRMVSL